MVIQTKSLLMLTLFRFRYYNQEHSQGVGPRAAAGTGLEEHTTRCASMNIYAAFCLAGGTRANESGNNEIKLACAVSRMNYLGKKK